VLSLRVTRDRRGYEHIYLVHETRRRGRPEGRLLYWSRSPGPLRVGREMFDAETRNQLEQANPDVIFDWPALLKQLQSSTAAARWAAHQQRAGQPNGAPRRRGEGQQPPRARSSDAVEDEEPDSEES
jgi:hypothetical protein